MWKLCDKECPLVAKIWLQELSLTHENVDNVSRETYGTKNLEKSYPQKRGVWNQIVTFE